MSSDEISKLIDKLKRRGGDQGGSGGVRPKGPTGDKPGGGFSQALRGAKVTKADNSEYNWPGSEGFDQASRGGAPKRNRVLEALAIASTIMGLFDDKPKARKGKENVDTVGALANDLRRVKDEMAVAIDKFKNPDQTKDKFDAIVDFADAIGNAKDAIKRARERWGRNNPKKVKDAPDAGVRKATPKGLPSKPSRPAKPGPEEQKMLELERQMNLLGRSVGITTTQPADGRKPDLIDAEGKNPPMWFTDKGPATNNGGMKPDPFNWGEYLKGGDSDQKSSSEGDQDFYGGFAQAPSEAGSPKDVKAVTRSNTDAEASLFSDLKDRIKAAGGRQNQWKKNYTEGATRDDDFVNTSDAPINPGSDHVYSGANMFALSAAAQERGYTDRRWMTVGQARKMGAQVRQGEQGVRILAPTTRTLPDGSRVIEMKPTWVFNAEQMDNLGPDTAPKNSGMTAGEAVDFLLIRFAEAESKRKGGDQGLRIEEGRQNGPRWMPNSENGEVIRMPDRSQFDSPEAYVQSIMHEITHATGDRPRLARDANIRGRSRGADQALRDYEELTAELGSAILMQRLGIPFDRQKHAEYLKMYMDGGLISEEQFNMAFADAQAAADYALGNDVLPRWDNLTTDFTPAPKGYRPASTPSWSNSTKPSPNDAAPAVPAGTPGSEDNPEIITGFAQDARDGKKSVKDSQSAVDKVTSQILDKLKEGTLPWRKPFTGIPGANMQRNPSTKRVYTGYNQQILSMVQAMKGYSDPRWMTYKQAEGMGGQVRKGERGTFILVPLALKREDAKTGEEKSFVTFKAVAVFNAEQIDGLTLPDLKSEAGKQMTPLDAHEFIVERYKKAMEARTGKPVDISYRDMSDTESPHWSPTSDRIVLPNQSQFNTPEDMFDTLAHEMVHSTGHGSRLDRTDLTKDYGNADGVARAKEELIAEIGAATIADMFGIETTLDNSASYVQSWLQRLQEHPEEVMHASREAQKAVDYLLGVDLGDWSPLEGYGLGNAVVPKTEEEES
jgi:antirestriction protein ArdC